MMNLTTTNNPNSENSYLYFENNKKKYALKMMQVIEIIKLPHLEYPQKLANNIVGLLNYNHIMIDVVDIRFYLNKKVEKYSTDTQLVIVKTDESIFGIIIDNVINLIDINIEKTEIPPVANDNQIVDFLYRSEISGEIISAINLY